MYKLIYTATNESGSYGFMYSKHGFWNVKQFLSSNWVNKNEL